MRALSYHTWRGCWNEHKYTLSRVFATRTCHVKTETHKMGFYVVLLNV